MSFYATSDKSAPLRLGIPFRWRLALASQGLVLVTIGLMLIPLYVGTRSQVLSTYTERLTAIARGTAVAIPASTVDSLAQSTAELPIPYVVIQSVLREFWRGPTGNTTADGLFLVRQQGSTYHVIASSGWGLKPPARLPMWTAPPGLHDSLANVHAGTEHLYSFRNGASLIVVSPVMSANSVAAGLVVASVNAGVPLNEARHQMIRLAWLPAIALLIAIALSTWIARQLTRRVEVLARRAKELASGDLRWDQDDESADELGILSSALGSMAAQLRTIVEGVQERAAEVSAAVESLAVGSEHMRTSSREVANAAQSIAVAATQQTGGITAILSIASGATTQAEEVASFARSAEIGAEEITDAARALVSGADVTLQRMLAISTVTADATPAVADLGRKSRRIGEFAGVIANLASQSNVLAVNAAIEASRAGPEARGFAVVAGEMRTLARETATALASINDLAREINEVSDLTRERMIEVRESVKVGEVSIRDAVQSLHSIVAVAEKGRSAAQQIAVHAEAQHSRAADVAAEIRAVAAAAADNAVIAEEVTASARAQALTASDVAKSSERLSEVATRLRSYLAVFRSPAAHGGTPSARFPKRLEPDNSPGTLRVPPDVSTAEHVLERSHDRRKLA